MKRTYSAIALTLMFSTVLVTVPVQPVTAEHRPTEGKQSFDDKPELRRWTQACRVQYCKKQFPSASPESLEELIPNDQLPESRHILNKFHTTFEPPSKEEVFNPFEPPSKEEVFNQLRHTAFTTYSLLNPVKNSQYFLPHKSMFRPH